MEIITSRKNPFILSLRTLAREPSERETRQEFLCDGEKLLKEALDDGMEITSVLWKEQEGSLSGRIGGCRQAVAPSGLFDYASPLSNSPGPLFTVRMPATDGERDAKSVIILENVQDPGNVGTVIRTANALGIEAVILCGACAQLYSPKTVRATMGAVFRQRVLTLRREEVKRKLALWDLPLYGAVLSDRAESVLRTDLRRCAVAVGSEGRGLSREMREECDGEIIIPMTPGSESLNASVAAALLMWEMRRGVL